MDIDLKYFHKKVFSQFGQDGVLEKIFELVKPVNKFFVEFGSSGNDVDMGNTSNLRREGFTGLLMDGSENPYGHEKNALYEVKIELVTTDNVNDLFKKHGVAQKFAFLSIDVDGNDYWIWKALNYEPQVVCIESNPSLPMDKPIVHKHDKNFVWKGDDTWGASCFALQKLARSKGYSLVAFCTCDMIFIKDECLPPDVNFVGMNSVKQLCFRDESIFVPIVSIDSDEWETV